MVRPDQAARQDRQPGRAQQALEVRHPGQEEEACLERAPGRVAAANPFAFVQFEFGFRLGPTDGRYMVRSEPGGEPESILVLNTLGAPERRLLRGRRGERVQEATPEPVPTSRATVIHPQPFDSSEVAADWLADRRGNRELADGEVAQAIGVLNRALHAHRAARADGNARDVTAQQALVTRLGFGSGESVADGRYSEGWELPHSRQRTPRSMEAPDERFAAILGGRESALACEELVLRARADVDANRMREAALQSRVALECLLAELEDVPSRRRADLDAARAPVGAAANAALHGELDEPAATAVTEAVKRMEAALRAVRVRGAR